jgi:hypothetical protein
METIRQAFYDLVACREADNIENLPYYLLTLFRHQEYKHASIVLRRNCSSQFCSIRPPFNWPSCQFFHSKKRAKHSEMLQC